MHGLTAAYGVAGVRSQVGCESERYAREKSAVLGICGGGVPMTIAICLRSVGSIARGSCVYGSPLT